MLLRIRFLQHLYRGYRSLRSALGYAMYREDYLNQFRVSHTEITSKIIAESPREVTTESKTVAPADAETNLMAIINMAGHFYAKRDGGNIICKKCH